MKIAVIDSGLPKYCQDEYAHRIVVDKDYKAYLSKKEVYDENGHGTIVRRIIDKYLDKGDEVLTVKILNKNLDGNSVALINAVDHCIENEVRIINISLGTVSERFKKEMQASIKKAVRSGIIIVAAEHNDGLKSYPANFKEVIGVRKLNSKIPHEKIFYNQKENFFQIRIREKLPLKIIWSLKKVYPVSGTSFLAPHVTGVISRIIKEKNLYGQEEIIREVACSFEKYLK